MSKAETEIYMTVPLTAGRSFMAEIDGFPTLEWNVELTATCPKCGSIANVLARDGAQLSFSIRRIQ
jgi:hypothetical protein